MMQRSRMMVAGLAVATAAAVGGCQQQRPIDVVRVSGDNHFRAANYEAARDEYAELTARYPGDWEAQYRLGSCLLKTGDYSAARRALEIAHTQRPHNHDIANALAEAMFRQGDEARLFAFLRGRAAETQSVDAYVQLARYSMDMGDPDSARTAIDTAIQIDNGRTTAPYLEAARIAQQLGQLDTAVKRLRQAYGINPNDPRVTDGLRTMGEQMALVTPLPPGR